MSLTGWPFRDIASMGNDAEVCPTGAAAEHHRRHRRPSSPDSNEGSRQNAWTTGLHHRVESVRARETAPPVLEAAKRIDRLFDIGRGTEGVSEAQHPLSLVAPRSKPPLRSAIHLRHLALDGFGGPIVKARPLDNLNGNAAQARQERRPVQHLEALGHQVFRHGGNR